MSESFIRRLTSLTPNAAALDRDGLMFAAGQAAARSRRRWPILCGCLAASQLLTLTLLWPRHAESPATAQAAPRNVQQAADDDVPAAPANEGPTLANLRDLAVATEGKFQPPGGVDSSIPPEAPLRAFGAIPASLLD